jgi:hypothetical protein
MTISRQPFEGGSDGIPSKFTTPRKTKKILENSYSDRNRKHGEKKCDQSIQFKSTNRSKSNAYKNKHMMIEYDTNLLGDHMTNNL